MYTKVTDFCSDYFFHYLMYHCDNLRLELCKFLSNDSCIESTTIENSDTYSVYKDGNRYIMDIVVRDNKHRYYNYEMQNGNITYGDIKRFQIYAMRLIEQQMIGKKTTKRIKKVRQLIIYTGKAIRNFDYYQHKIELYDKKYQVTLDKGLITMNIIQVEKMEEDDMDVMRNDIHQVMRLFKNEEVHKEEQVSELAKEVVEMYDRYLDSEEYLSYIQIERDRFIINDKMEEHFIDGIIVGKKEGLIEGKKEGLIEAKTNAVKTIIEEKYHVNELSWLNECNEKQLDKVFKLMYKDISYEELEREILKID